MLDQKTELFSERRLDGLEKAFYLLDQYRPTHFVLAAEVTGDVSAGLWGQALATAGERSLWTSAQITEGDDGSPVFRPGPPRAIPLATTPLDPAGWARSVEEELAMPFDTGRDPLVRARLLEGRGRCVLILVFHHAIADGPSAVFFMRDILRLAAGETVAIPIDPRSLERSIDERPWPVVDMPSLRMGDVLPPPGFRPRHLRRPHVRTASLTLSETDSLRRLARDRGATVQGALCAAAARAFDRRHPDLLTHPPRVFSPVDVRRRLPNGAEHLGVFVNGLTVERRTSEGTFWDDALTYSKRLSAFQDSRTCAAGVRAVQAAASPATTPEQVAQGWAEIFGAEVVVSNLGLVDVPVRYGPLTVTALWGPAVSLGIDGEHVLGVTTFGGSLRIVHTSYDPEDAFLGLLERELRAAGVV